MYHELPRVIGVVEPEQFILFWIDWANGPTPYNVGFIISLVFLYVLIGAITEGVLQTADKKYANSGNCGLAGVFWIGVLPIVIGFEIGKFFASPSQELPPAEEVIEKEKKRLTKLQQTPCQTETVP